MKNQVHIQIPEPHSKHTSKCKMGSDGAQTTMHPQGSHHMGIIPCKLLVWVGII